MQEPKAMPGFECKIVPSTLIKTFCGNSNAPDARWAERFLNHVDQGFDQASSLIHVEEIAVEAKLRFDENLGLGEPVFQCACDWPDPVVQRLDRGRPSKISAKIADDGILDIRCGRKPIDRKSVSMIRSPGRPGEGSKVASQLAELKQPFRLWDFVHRAIQNGHGRTNQQGWSGRQDVEPLRPPPLPAGRRRWRGPGSRRGRGCRTIRGRSGRGRGSPCRRRGPRGGRRGRSG